MHLHYTGQNNAPTLHRPKQCTYIIRAKTMHLHYTGQNNAPTLHGTKQCTYITWAKTMHLHYMGQNSAPALHGPKQCTYIIWTNWLRVFPDILYCEDDAKHTDTTCRKKQCIHVKAGGTNSNHHDSNRKQPLTSITCTSAVFISSHSSVLSSPVVIVLSSFLVTTPVPAVVVFISSFASILPITTLLPTGNQHKAIPCNVHHHSLYHAT